MERLPNIFRALESLPQDKKYISSVELGDMCGISDVQIRKDLTIFKDIGRPAQGYRTDTLLRKLRRFFGIHNDNSVVLVGCGNLGKALIHFPGFKDIGIHIALIFDNDLRKVGSKINSIEVQAMDNFVHYTQRLNIQIGVIATPADTAQKIGEMMGEAGIIYIRNFAQTVLKLPDHIKVHNEDLSAGFLLASQYVRERSSG